MSEINGNNGEGQSLMPDSLKEELGKIQKMTEGTYTPPEIEAASGKDDEAIITPPVDKQDEPEKPPVTTDDDDEGDDPDDLDDDDEDDDNKTDKGIDPDAGNKDRKVVPIKRLHDEERKRKDAEAREAELKKQLEGLGDIGRKTTAGSLKEADAIKKWAEKNGYEAEGMEELVQIIRAGSEVDQETIIKNLFGDGADLEVIKEAVDMARMQKETQTFEKEFKSLEPELKKKYPDATDAQIAAAKKKLDDISHSEWGHNKDLDYIVFKKEETFNKIFTATAPAPKGKVGPEGSRIGSGQPKGYTAKDFTGKDAKSFSELAKLPETEREKIVAEFDPFTKMNYWKSLGGNNGDVIKRGGQTVSS